MSLHANRKTQEIRRSLRASVIDGCFYCVMYAFGEAYFGLYAVYLGATPTQLATLATLGPMLGAFGQIASIPIVLKIKSRKKFVIITSIVQAACVGWMPLIMYLPQGGSSWMVLLATTYFLFIISLGPAWQSWMGDLAQGGLRQKYFPQRAAATYLVLMGSLLVSYLLRKHALPSAYWMYTVFFPTATAARLVSVYYLTRKVEPNFQIPKASSPYGLRQFTAELGRSPFGRFCLCLFALNISLQTWLPFVADYMKNELLLPDDWVILSILILFSGKFIGAWLYGKSGRNTPGHVLLIGAAGLFALSLWPLLSFPGRYSIFIYQFIEGLAFGVLETVIIVQQIKFTNPDTRPNQIGYYGVFASLLNLGVALGAAHLLRHLQWRTFSKYQNLAALTCCFRMAAFLFILYMVLKQVAEGKKNNSTELPPPAAPATM